MKARRGVIVFLILGILIFSSISFVSAQEPGAGCEKYCTFYSLGGTTCLIYAYHVSLCCDPDTGEIPGCKDTGSSEPADEEVADIIESNAEEGWLCDQCEKEVGAEIEECYYRCQNPEEELTPSSVENELTNNSKTDTTTYVPEGNSNSVYIEGYKGEVLVKDINGNVKPLTGKIALVGDGITLITKETGKVLLIFNDGSKVELGQNSQFTLGNLEKESILNFGKIKEKIIKCFLTRCYPTRFPNAAVSIRGTEYVAIVDQYSNTTTILVNEGTVSLTETKTGSTQNISKGNSGVVDSSGIKMNLMSDAEWKNATGEFDLEKNDNSWTIYLGFFVVLLAIGLVYIYIKMKKRKDSKTIKKQSVEHKKLQKISGETKKWGIASLILAILSILFLLLPFVGIVLAILAVIFARIQKIHNPTGIATAGLVIGIIGIVLNIIMLILIAG